MTKTGRHCEPKAAPSIRMVGDALDCFVAALLAMTSPNIGERVP